MKSAYLSTDKSVSSIKIKTISLGTINGVIFNMNTDLCYMHSNVNICTI